MAERISMCPGCGTAFQVYPADSNIDLVSTPDLLAALERRFDTLVFAGTILLRKTPDAFQEQRIVRRKGHDLIQVGLVHVLTMHIQPQMLPADDGTPIGGPDGPKPETS